MMEIKSRIFQDLKAKYNNSAKMALVYDFLNRNATLMAEKFAKVSLKGGSGRCEVSEDLERVRYLGFRLAKLEEALIEKALKHSVVLI